MRKTENLTNPLYKYKVKALLLDIEDEQVRLTVKKEIRDACGISSTTMSRYLNIKKEDKKTCIPADFLKVFASKLNKPLEYLFN